MIKLLLVEDDPNLRYVVQCGLEDIIGGYDVQTAANGEEGLKAWATFKPDIIISDIDMPVMDGFEMVRRIRETDANIPILFASALTSPKDVRFGYQLGVNNYVKKPFIAEELDAHIHAVLKMTQGVHMRTETGFCQFGSYTLDTEHNTLRDDRTDNILHILAQNKNETVRREAILSRCWNTEDDYFASRSLDVFVSKLRKLFEADADIEIKTVRGVGLMLVTK